MKNKNLRIMFFVNNSTHTQYLQNEFLQLVGIFIENKILLKKILVKVFFISNSFIFFYVGFQRFFADISVSFQYFLKWVSALKFP